MSNPFSANQNKLATIGRCIYCGSTREPLTKEHIIPQGLNGTQYLALASCEECRIKTHKFEENVLRKMMWPMRRHLGAGGKNKPPPKTIRMHGQDTAGKQTAVDLEHQNIPYKAVLPIFTHPPAILAGPWPKDDKAHVQIFYDQKAIKRAADSGMHSTVLDVISPDFIRMLAKIAHCQCVANLGVDGFEPFLPELIGGKMDNWNNYVGGAPIDKPPADNLVAHCETHRLHGKHEGFLLGRIRLLGIFNGPIYDVAIGRSVAGYTGPGISQ